MPYYRINKDEQKVYDLKEARRKIEHFCAYQERSHKQVKEKLLSFGLLENVADELISELIQENFLNETRFAETFTRGKFLIKGWGRIKIKQHLKQHYVSEYNINKALKQIKADEYQEMFETIASKKWAVLKGENAKLKKQKLQRFMYSRGFESDMIYDFLRDK
jgi:regulatory protein